MARLAALVLALWLIGCGGSGIEGTLEWQDDPAVTGTSATGVVHNTTSHSVALDPKRLRLLDDHGRKVAGKFRVGSQNLAGDAATPLRATWKSGKPVRIDYGSGTLALTSE